MHGQYIKQMSSYCSGCRYKPCVKAGSNVCPVSTRYWNFLDKREDVLAENPRIALMVKNAACLSTGTLAAIREQAAMELNNVDNV